MGTFVGVLTGLIAICGGIDQINKSIKDYKSKK